MYMTIFSIRNLRSLSGMLFLLSVCHYSKGVRNTGFSLQAPSKTPKAIH